MTGRVHCGISSPASDDVVELLTEPSSGQAVEVKIDSRVAEEQQKYYRAIQVPFGKATHCLIINQSHKHEKIYSIRKGQNDKCQGHYDDGQGHRVGGLVPGHKLHSISRGQALASLPHRDGQFPHQDTVAQSQAGKGDNAKDQQFYVREHTVDEVEILCRCIVTLKFSAACFPLISRTP